MLRMLQFWFAPASSHKTCQNSIVTIQVQVLSVQSVLNHSNLKIRFSDLTLKSGTPPLITFLHHSDSSDRQPINVECYQLIEDFDTIELHSSLSQACSLL